MYIFIIISTLLVGVC